MHAVDARPIGVCTGLIISLPSYALVQIQATAAVTSVTSSITSPSRDQGSAAGYTFQNRLAPGVIGYEPRHQTMGLESTPVVSKKSLCRGFDRMIKETRPDTVVVTTVDATHAHYIVRALELGCDVMTEKPLCTDEEQCLSILDAQRKSGKKVTVTFNARHDPEAKKVKELLMEKAVGDVISVDFHEYLDTSHGADYFRRWHRLKENSGTLLVHKASHHFDLANWWVDSTPVEVTAFGDLKFYGRNNSFRNTHCRGCPFKQQCKFYWDVTQNPQYVKLYTDCESEDGYLRDGCVWREDINIYDTMSVVVKYENGVRLTYTANTFLPYEGQSISINGSRGRLDYNEVKANGFTNNEVRLTRSFGKSEAVTDIEQARAGGHGGADTSIQVLIFRGSPGSDPLKLCAGLRAGALSRLVGISGRYSLGYGDHMF